MRTEAKIKKALDTAKTIARTILFPVSGTLAVEANASLEIPVPGSYTVFEVYINVKTAPTGAAIIVDVNKNGTTIFTNQAHRPQISAGVKTGSTSDIDVSALTQNDILSVDIDQVGSTIAGANLVVEIRCTEVV